LRFFSPKIKTIFGSKLTTAKVKLRQNFSKLRNVKITDALDN